MLSPRGDHTSLLLPDGRVLLVGGSGDGRACERYDPETATWSGVAPTNSAHFAAHAVFLDERKILLVGFSADFDGGGLAEIYDLATDAWTNAPSPSTNRHWFTLTRLGNGQVLLVGETATAEVFDPDAGTWTQTQPLVDRRERHSAQLLVDGTVLATGGIAPGVRLNSAEVYDPATRTWHNVGPMLNVHLEHTSTVLLDDQVLIAGGNYGAPERYQPLCASDSVCRPGSHCAAGFCTPRRPLGDPCVEANACTSGFCVDGHCCDSACGGLCDGCGQPMSPGTCLPYPPGSAQTQSATCYPFVCGGSADCPTACVTQADCAIGLTCVAGDCVRGADAGVTPASDAGTPPMGARVRGCGCSESPQPMWLAVALGGLLAFRSSLLILIKSPSPPAGPLGIGKPRETSRGPAASDQARRGPNLLL